MGAHEIDNYLKLGILPYRMKLFMGVALSAVCAVMFNNAFVAMEKVKVCLRCGHGWRSLRRSPVVCPRCKSPYWNVPREK